MASWTDSLPSHDPTLTQCEEVAMMEMPVSHNALLLSRCLSPAHFRLFLGMMFPGMQSCFISWNLFSVHLFELYVTFPLSMYFFAFINIMVRRNPSETVKHDCYNLQGWIFVICLISLLWPLIFWWKLRDTVSSPTCQVSFETVYLKNNILYHHFAWIWAYQ
jgi:hypothetical protein